MLVSMRILADGKWHEREEIIRAVMKVIPPGLAYRHAEYVRKKQYVYNLKKKGKDPEKILPPPRIANRTADEVIEFGKRSLARTKLPKYEYLEKDGTKIRLIPRMFYVSGTLKTVLKENNLPIPAYAKAWYENGGEEQLRKEASAAAYKAHETMRKKYTPEERREQRRKGAATRIKRHGPDTFKQSSQTMRDKYTKEERAEFNRKGAETRKKKAAAKKAAEKGEK
jgi:hypothetical protein